MHQRGDVAGIHAKELLVDDLQIIVFSGDNRERSGVQSERHIGRRY